MKKPHASNIDEYIEGFPSGVQEKLSELRAIIRKAAPQAEETISYAIPCFRTHGRYLIYFAGYKSHIGVYPVPNTKEFEKDYAPYATSGKGTLQLPLDKPIPATLIRKIVKYRLAENAARSSGKKSEKSGKAPKKKTATGRKTKATVSKAKNK